MSTWPILHIFTGPPGSGKSTKARETGLPVYDNDLGNAREWMTKHEDACLTVTAPTERDKQYWISLAKSHGFKPKLYCIWMSKMEAFTRMKARSGGAPRDGAGQSNTADKWVHYWFKKYSRHPQEERITNARSQAS